MIEGGVAEIGGVAVAGTARALVVIGRGRVAPCAIFSADGGVVEGGIAEIGGVAVAGAAGTFVMVGRWGVAGAAFLAAHEGMIECYLLPTGDDVTGRAVCAILTFMGFIFGVTGDAGGAGSLVIAGGVAVGAFQVVVSAGEREEAVVHRPIGKWYGQRI